jgi:hypothetical protein
MSQSISLSLTAGYARHWGTWEGVREFVQNWHDGVVAQSSSSQKLCFSKHADAQAGRVNYQAASSDGVLLGTVEYDTATEQLRMTNRRTALSRKVLLMGFSNKPQRKEIVGQFGEGMKVGALALLRGGIGVRMTTNSEHWDFQLEVDEAFDERVLTIMISDWQAYAAQEEAERTATGVALDEQEDGESSEGWEKKQAKPVLEDGDTLTVIEGLKQHEWLSMVGKFLFLEPPDAKEQGGSDGGEEKEAEGKEEGKEGKGTEEKEPLAVKTVQGTLLLADRYRQQMFVKGIWINEVGCMLCSYYY